MIQLRTLNLEALDCFSNVEHMRLKRQLNEDRDVCTYISKHFDTWVKEPNEKNEFEVGKAYVIADKSNKIGMLGSCDTSSNGIIELWCAIHKNFRKQGYAEKVLVQITDYLVENNPDLVNIRLKIKQDNLGSNKVALYSGYELVDHYDQQNIYQYFK